jgi:hypothetical protein
VGAGSSGAVHPRGRVRLVATATGLATHAAGKRTRRIRAWLGPARTTRGTVGLDELRGIGWVAVPEPDPRGRDGREDTCATRYEKIARNYRAVVTLAAIILWMR